MESQRLLNNILSLDPATETGWAVFLDGRLSRSDSFKLSQVRKWKVFFTYVGLLCKKYNIDKIVYEMPVYSGQAGATIHHSKLAGIIELLCQESDIEYEAVDTRSVKKFQTGNGNADKDLMVATCNEKFGLELTNHNTADAILIGDYWVKNNISGILPSKKKIRKK